MFMKPHNSNEQSDNSLDKLLTVQYTHHNYNIATTDGVDLLKK